MQRLGASEAKILELGYPAIAAMKNPITYNFIHSIVNDYLERPPVLAEAKEIRCHHGFGGRTTYPPDATRPRTSRHRSLDNSTTTSDAGMTNASPVRTHVSRNEYD